jgi:hypothetical protein
MRRIKNVTLTIPCVVGPYTGVHCRLTLLSSTTRVDPRLADPPLGCCDGGSPSNGYQALPDDPRIVKAYAATEAIATSSGQNDSGLFELSFRDERYLPFEFAGAISRWRVELPQENNQFDLDTVSDVILHLNYTAREGGEVLRGAANTIAQRSLPGTGVKLFDIQHDFPDAWQILQSSAGAESPRQFGLRLSRSMFPFLPGRRQLRIRRLDLLFEAPGANPSASRVVEFLAGHRIGHSKHARCNCARHDMTCVASAEWPDLFHGVLDDIHVRPLAQNGYHDLGTFRLPADTGEVERAFLLCSYEVD